MPEAQPSPIRRADYTPPAFLVDSVDLGVEILADQVRVTSTLTLRRNPAAAPGQPLVLNGEGLTTEGAALDGHPVPHTLAPKLLTITDLPERPFTLVTVVTIDPWSNTALSGLYKSGDLLCTQCEAEGFRRITWYPDRPDVMARFRVAIEAEKGRFPVLLSNGNRTLAEDLPGGRHRVVWEDPFPKPCYLFALVAGDLAVVEGSFATRSGRDVALKFWVEHGNEDQVGHAAQSLKHAMAWDEQVFGLEYDLDIYNVVAVSHFNMGAMENKSLNVFNSKYVLAKQSTATDTDFLGIESVIAHEYFHNWTGNRVTCRDWFQLTLKEGLTVFRDQEFSGDMNSRALKRIEDVRGLRMGQFPEDNGPMAHPIRPDSYIEINNFYTATVYQKGAEVIRMIHTIIGPQSFRKGMDLYFARFDGQAVTCEDFVAAMEDASGVDLGQFRRWYSQAGTPRVTAEWSIDAAARRMALTLSQTTRPDQLPFVIPIRAGLVGGPDATRTLLLSETSQTFVFEDASPDAVPSLLRGFSAPVILDAPYGDAELAFLMAEDSDPFNRWEAGQRLATRTLLGMVAARADGCDLRADPGFVEAWGRVLADAGKDPAFAAEALTLPTASTLGEQMEVIDVDGIHAARRFIDRALAKRFHPELTALRGALVEREYRLTPEAIGRRRLGNLALMLTSQLDGPEAAEAQFRSATCMTDQLAALAVLIDLGPEIARPALDAFLDRWRSEGLVVNKWLALQAMADWEGALEHVRALTRHPAYDAGEPNKIYALLGGFGANQKRFHRPDGAGYDFLAEQVTALDAANPQVAARMVRPLIRWKRFDARRQERMKAALERIRAIPTLSRDTGEIVAKALEG